MPIVGCFYTSLRILTVAAPCLMFDRSNVTEMISNYGSQGIYSETLSSWHLPQSVLCIVQSSCSGTYPLHAARHYQTPGSSFLAPAPVVAATHIPSLSHTCNLRQNLPATVSTAGGSRGSELDLLLAAVSAVVLWSVSGAHCSLVAAALP